MDFQLNTELTEGFQGTGFTIEFTSTANVAGAYILFKDSEGNATRIILTFHLLLLEAQMTA